MKAPTHILLVDDEEAILEPLQVYLAAQGFEISVAPEAVRALQLAAEIPFALAVLDVMIGRDDGFALCRDLQKVRPTPVIFLSGRAEDTERIIGLELGADDYITKPFNPRELLARVRAVLRRYTAAEPATAKAPQQPQRLGPWQLDVVNQELVGDDGSKVSLSTGEARLLSVLLQHPNKVLSRDDLLELTQGRLTNPFDRSIDNYISRLRKKIEKDPANPTLIKTYWGGGYSLNSQGE